MAFDHAAPLITARESVWRCPNNTMEYGDDYSCCYCQFIAVAAHVSSPASQCSAVCLPCSCNRHKFTVNSTHVGFCSCAISCHCTLCRLASYCSSARRWLLSSPSPLSCTYILIPNIKPPSVYPVTQGRCGLSGLYYNCVGVLRNAHARDLLEHVALLYC